MELSATYRDTYLGGKYEYTISNEKEEKLIR